MWAIITSLVTSYIVGIWTQDSSSLLHVLNREFLFDSVKFILNMDKKTLSCNEHRFGSASMVVNCFYEWAVDQCHKAKIQLKTKLGLVFHM